MGADHRDSLIRARGNTRDRSRLNSYVTLVTEIKFIPLKDLANPMSCDRVSDLI